MYRIKQSKEIFFFLWSAFFSFKNYLILFRWPSKNFFRLSQILCLIVFVHTDLISHVFVRKRFFFYFSLFLPDFCLVFYTLFFYFLWLAAVLRLPSILLCYSVTVLTFWIFLYFWSSVCPAFLFCKSLISLFLKAWVTIWSSVSHKTKTSTEILIFFFNNFSWNDKKIFFFKFNNCLSKSFLVFYFFWWLNATAL